jgi:hypothetical protein
MAYARKRSKAQANKLKIGDDGASIPQNGDGRPDFSYVTTPICDSIKRQLTADRTEGLSTDSADNQPSSKLSMDTKSNGRL